MYPDAVIQFQDVFGQIQQLGCGQAQSMVESGLAPEGFCGDIFPFAVKPCNCVQPNGTPVIVSTPNTPTFPTNPSPPASPPISTVAPSAPTAVEACPNRRRILQDCLETVENGSDCVDCVTSYWSASFAVVDCTSIDKETCRALHQCPCGKCLVKFVRYVKCLAPECASSLQCSGNNTSGQTGGGGGAGSVEPVPTQGTFTSQIPLPSGTTGMSTGAPSPLAKSSERTIFSGAMIASARGHHGAITVVPLAVASLFPGIIFRVW
jgi:hypothetical protein